MWDALYAKKILDLNGQPSEMTNSPFAFPKLPPRTNLQLGISNASSIKDAIVKDKNAMMGRLFDYHEMFQIYAADLFDLSLNRFVPGHPMHVKAQSFNTLQENYRLRKENAAVKADLTKEKIK